MRSCRAARDEQEVLLSKAPSAYMNTSDVQPLVTSNETLSGGVTEGPSSANSTLDHTLLSQYGSGERNFYLYIYLALIGLLSSLVVTRTLVLFKVMLT